MDGNSSRSCQHSLEVLEGLGDGFDPFFHGRSALKENGVISEVVGLRLRQCSIGPLDLTEILIDHIPKGRLQESDPAAGFGKKDGFGCCPLQSSSDARKCNSCIINVEALQKGSLIVQGRGASFS